MCFLDDDNLPHDEFFVRLSRIQAGHDAPVAVVFSQILRSGRPRLHAAPAQMIPCAVDTAQVVFPRAYAGDLRFQPSKYEADGVFFEALFRQNSEATFHFVDERLVYYNALRAAA